MSSDRSILVILLRMATPVLLPFAGFRKAGLSVLAYDGLPTPQLGLDSAALIIAAAGLPRHATTGLYFCNVLVPKRWIMRRLRAVGGVLWRRDGDLDRRTKSRFEQVVDWDPT